MLALNVHLICLMVNLSATLSISIVIMQFSATNLFTKALAIWGICAAVCPDLYSSLTPFAMKNSETLPLSLAIADESARKVKVIANIGLADARSLSIFCICLD